MSPLWSTIPSDGDKQFESTPPEWPIVSSVCCGYVTKIEQQQLNYIALNQRKIRVDLYSGLADADAVAAGDTL